VKYVDASALLRVLLRQPGPSFLPAEDVVVSSRILEVEAFRAVDRLRLLGSLDDTETAIKRAELTELLSRIDLMAVDDRVIERARSSFAVNLRALDAIHVGTAEVAADGGEPLEFWTHDERQRIAALSRGLTVRG
jgi:predicted nucleic acid-binding protein